MILSFRKAAGAITEAVLAERAGPGAVSSAPSVAEFVLAQHGRMPDYLRAPLVVLTCLCDLWPVFGFGRPLHRLQIHDRRRVVVAWRRSRLGFCRNLIKFYESLAVYGWASERPDPSHVR
jgi:hypothetical protein